MEMMKKMMECLGNMSKEEKEKMMEKCLTFMKEQGKGEEDRSDEEKSDDKACCPDMMEKFMGQMTGFTEKKGKSITKEEEADTNSCN